MNLEQGSVSAVMDLKNGDVKPTRARKPRGCRKGVESRKRKGRTDILSGIKQEEGCASDSGATKVALWTPVPYDFVYTDTWLYRLQNGKRVSLRAEASAVSEPEGALKETELATGDKGHATGQEGGKQELNTNADSKKETRQEAKSEAKAPRRNRKRCKPSAIQGLSGGGGLNGTTGVSVRRECQLFIPAFLTRGLWTRHRYTLADISLTLQCFKPYHLWHLAISERLSLTKLAVQASCATKDAFVYGAKAIVISHLEAWLADTFEVEKGQPSVLTNTESSHVPPLPVWSIEPEEFQIYLNMLPKKGGRNHDEQGSRAGNAEWYPVSEPVAWRGICVLPMELERSRHLLMARVVSAEEYTHIFGEPECLTMQPLHVTLVNGSTWAVCDEAFHFVVRPAQT